MADHSVKATGSKGPMGIGLAVGLLVIGGIGLNRCDDAREQAEGGERSTAVVSHASTEDVQQISASAEVHRATPLITITAPSNRENTWAMVEGRRNWTMCAGNKEGIDTLYQTRTHQWVSEVPADGVVAWRYRSKTDEPRPYTYNLDTSPLCDTPVPAS